MTKIRKIVNKTMLIFLLFFVTIGVVGCKENGNNPDPDKPPVVKPDPDDEKEIVVGISGDSEVRSGQTISLSATVTGTTNQEVIWEIKTGSDYATITEKGKLTAKTVSGDKIIEVVAKSKEDENSYATKLITIVAPPELTQDMLDTLKTEQLSFEGYINISLYTIGLFEKLYSTYTTQVKTAMDGTNWYSEYENGDTGTTMSMYYKNHNDLACEVSVSLMNDEKFYPMEDEDGQYVSWTDAGLYNNFLNLTINDFKFNEKTWRYEYCGGDDVLVQRMIASANPYEFVPLNFALIIEEGEIMGIYSKSDNDYTIVEGYKAVQELYVAINYGETVEVPTISKYSHEEIHDTLQVAINNMQALDSYELEYNEFVASVYASGVTQSGFTETITTNNCYFQPFKVSYSTSLEEIHTYLENATYGYAKINDHLYNSYEEKNGGFEAIRAYEKDFSNAKPTFAFAPEIFRSFYYDQEEKTTTYYVDDAMSSVATTFYYGLGNDINLYGIFATRGYTSSSESFTPYVVVKDGYIIEACFYFYLGSMYGVVELKYDKFNEATLPDDVDIKFDTRLVPTSWDELTIYVSKDSTDLKDDEERNALEYLKSFYNDEDIANKLPFFGKVLGDTYAFGLTTIRVPGGSNVAKSAIALYYDVPLDIDYTIDSSLKAVETYLVSLGFEKNSYGEYVKDGITVLPVDSSLDLFIYIW